MKYVLDIETTMDHRTIRLCGIMREDGKFRFMDKEGLNQFLLGMSESDTLITYNGVSFDIPVLESVWGVSFAVAHKDAFLLSKMLDPDRPSHSLRAWGKELFPNDEEEQKGEVDYDNAPVEELIEYNKKDLRLTLNVFNHLCGIARKGGDWKKAYTMEHRVREIITEQKAHGFSFDTERAKEVHAQIQAERIALEEAASEWLPWAELPESRKVYPPKIQFKKDGEMSKHMEAYLEKMGAVFIDGKQADRPHCVLREGKQYLLPLTEPFETEFKVQLKDQQELKGWLLAQGWEPTLFNDDKGGKKGTPRLYDKITKDVCPNLLKVLKEDQVYQIKRWLMLRSRENVILSENGTGWLTEVTPEGRIHADADTIGTPTARFKHRTIVNIPRVGSDYGEELRSLFTASEGTVNGKPMVMVGWDASSLEACMEAHYVYPFDPEYAQELMEGDVHSRNQERLGLPSRAVAKTFKYAITYGARPKKLASSLGVSVKEATAWFDEFWKENTGLAQLLGYLKTEWEIHHGKYLVGLDGRLLSTRAEHALLNTKLQGAGAILMKTAMVIADREIRTRGIPAHGLIRYHDEEQWECPEDVADLVGQIGVQSIERAATYWKLNVPVTGEYKVGLNWAGTH